MATPYLDGLAIVSKVAARRDETGAILRYDPPDELREALQQIRAETLIVHGFDEKVIPYELSVRMLTLIPDSRLYVPRLCGHWAQLEHADAFNRHHDPADGCSCDVGNGGRSARPSAP